MNWFLYRFFYRILIALNHVWFYYGPFFALILSFIYFFTIINKASEVAAGIREPPPDPVPTNSTDPLIDPQLATNSTTSVLDTIIETVTDPGA